MEPNLTSPRMTSRRRLLGCALALLVAMAAGGWPGYARAAGYPNDTLYPRQWNLRRMGVPEAWKTTKGKGVTIAIVDSGVDRFHLDLAKNMVAGYNAFDGSGNAAESCPYDAPIKAHYCHGTAVAGTAAAVANNNRGVAGVAPEAKIMPIRIANHDGSFAGEINFNQALMWAADHGAKVINLSVGLGLAGVPVPFPDVWLPGIAYATAKGALIVVAAGNAATPICEQPGYNPLVLCVGASDQADSITGFSNYGVRIDVVAPGAAIWTTTVGSTADTAGYYSPVYGTSFASPTVAGVAALLMSMGANNFEAANIIRATSKDLGLPGYDITYGFGRVSAAAAVKLCKQIC
jgi:thermitase